MKTVWEKVVGGYRAGLEDLIENDEMTSTGYVHLPDGRWVGTLNDPDKTPFQPHRNYDGEVTHRSAVIDGLRYKIVYPQESAK